MNLYQLLVESRIDFLKDKYSTLLKDKFYKKDLNIDIEYLKFYFETQFQRIIETDPTNNKIYLQWLLNNLLKFDFEDYFKFIGEDLYKWKEYLTIYHKVKNGLPLDKRDINKLSLNELKDIALQYKEKENEVGTKNEVLDKKYKIVEDDKYLVYMFKNSSKEDFKFYQLVSTSTEWCTRPDYKTFKDYIEEDPLFVFINKNDRSEKYQFHEESEQFMDKNDKEISNIKLIQRFLKSIKKYRRSDTFIYNGDNSQNNKNNSVIFDKNGNIILNNFYSIIELSKSVGRGLYGYNSLPKHENIVIVIYDNPNNPPSYKLYNIKLKKFIKTKDYRYMDHRLILNKYLVARSKKSQDLIDLDGNIILGNMNEIILTSDYMQPYILIQKQGETEKYIVNLEEMTQFGPFVSGNVFNNNPFSFIVKPTESSAKYEFLPYFKNKFRMISLDGDTDPELLNNLKTTKI